MPAVDELLDVIRTRSTGIRSHVHGETHWLVVAQAGLEVLEHAPDADREVVLLFALLHDTMRVHDGIDRVHGREASRFARALRGEGLLRLEPHRLDVLCDACDRHADGETTDDPTIAACWDADRLDIGRVGIRIDPAYLSTPVPDWGALIRRGGERRAQAYDWDGLAAAYRAGD